ncbi:MOSC domain-containing protein [Streptomyces sp. RM1]
MHTGAWKAPVQGSRMVRRLNVDGDGQGDLAGHGGEMRAVLTFGIFGENFTVDGLPDDEVCIGDRYRIGQAEFEISQPRVTCRSACAWANPPWPPCWSPTTGRASTSE